MKYSFSLVLLLVTFLFFGDILSSKTLFHKDMHTLLYPAKLFIYNSIKDGVFPFWNPYNACGEPLIPILYYQTLYPFSIFSYIFPSCLGMDIFIFLHIFLGSLFFYFLMKDQGLDISSSLFASLSYGFSGIFISLGNWVCLSTATWSPLILLFYIRALKRGSIFYTFASCVILVLGFCAGFPEVSFFCFLLLIFLTIAYIIHKKSFFSLKLFLITSLIIAGIGLFIFLPFLEFVLFSQRAGGISFSESTICSLSPFELLEFIFPCFYNIPREGYISSYFGEKITTSIYIGIFPIILAISAIFWIRNKNILFWGFVFILSLLIALGNNTPFYHILYKYIPCFNIIRYPVKALHLSGLAGSYLAGFGFFYLISQAHKKEMGKKFILLSLFFVLLFLFFYYERKYVFHILNYIMKGLYAPGRMEKGDIYIWYSFVSLNFLKVAFILFLIGIVVHFVYKYKISFILLKGFLITITIYDLYTFNGKLNYLIDEDFYKETPNIVEVLKDGYARFILTPDSKEEMGRGVEDYISREILWGNQHLPFRLFNAMGYEVIFIGGLLDFANSMPMNVFMKIMGVKYIVSLFPLIGKDISLHWKNGPIYVYKYNCHMNRAIFVSNAKVMDKDKILDYMSSPNFNPEKEVVLEEKPKKSQESEGQRVKGSEVNIIDYQPNRVLIEVDSEMSGFLVLSDTYYPGWKAYISHQSTRAPEHQKEVRIYRANYCFRAVCVPKGKSLIEFRYFPKTFIIGLIGSLASLLLIMVYLKRCSQ
ncbi:MAG: YfhO family protein [bacterium]